MAKWANTAVLDALLQEVAKGNVITATHGQPTGYTQATTTGGLELATTTGGVSTGDGNGDYTIATTGSNRKVTIGQQGTGNTDITNTGYANHIAVCDSSASTLLYVTTCTCQSLTTGNDVTFNSWSITVNAPS